MKHYVVKVPTVPKHIKQKIIKKTVTQQKSSVMLLKYKNYRQRDKNTSLQESQDNLVKDAYAGAGVKEEVKKLSEQEILNLLEELYAKKRNIFKRIKEGK